MTLIAISQRVAIDLSHGERRDCLDQRWSQLLGRLGAVLVPVPNGLSNTGGWLSAVGVQGVILSGGNSLSHLAAASDAAPERDQTETCLLDWAQSLSVPVLGICRGMQMMNCYLNGSLEPINNHAGTRHEVQTSIGARIVNSYHTYAVPKSGLAPDTRPTAWDGAEHVEAFAHEILPWAAIMWHPERELEPDKSDVRLLQTHFNLESRAP